MAGAGKAIDILLVENNPADARLTIEALKEVGLATNLTCVADGDDALEFLRRQGRYSGVSHPDLIFLDLNLQRVSGLEVLAEIKTNAELECIPVVVVSGSIDPRQIRDAYKLKANCYITKPADLNEFLEFIRSCFGFWGTAVTFPPKGASVA
jgi:Response regulator containing CheY-like receiver, AAA-type ATPase, and DNA-binding domains